MGYVAIKAARSGKGLAAVAGAALAGGFLGSMLVRENGIAGIHLFHNAVGSM